MKYDLSIVLPIACADPNLKLILGQLIATNRSFFSRRPSEIVLVDSIPNPRSSSLSPEIERLISAAGLDIKYLTTDLAGAGLKLDLGIEQSSATHILFYIDENYSLTDFIEPAMDLAERGYIPSIPYVDGQVPGGSSTPLRYPKHLPVSPITFTVLPRTMWDSFNKDRTRHLYGTLHWSLLAFETGRAPIFPAEFLHHCPILKFSVPKDGYTPFSETFQREDRDRFLAAWPQARVEDVICKMTEFFVATAAGRNPGLFLVANDWNEFHVVCGDPLKIGDSYKLTSDAEMVKRRMEDLLVIWRDTRSTKGIYATPLPVPRASRSSAEQAMRRAIVRTGRKVQKVGRRLVDFGKRP